MMESFFATLQTELLDRRAWVTLAELWTVVFHLIEVFYQSKRRHSSPRVPKPAGVRNPIHSTQAGRVIPAAEGGLQNRGYFMRTSIEYARAWNPQTGHRS